MGTWIREWPWCRKEKRKKKKKKKENKKRKKWIKWCMCGQPRSISAYCRLLLPCCFVVNFEPRWIVVCGASGQQAAATFPDLPDISGLHMWPLLFYVEPIGQ